MDTETTNDSVAFSRRVLCSNYAGRVLCIPPTVLKTVFFNSTRQVVHNIGYVCVDVSFALLDPLLWLDNESQSLRGVTLN